MELNEFLKIHWNFIVAIFDSMLCNCARSEAFKRSETDFMTFNEGFEMICKE